MKYATEAELAADVVKFLAASDWDCFQEVQLEWGSKRADIVCVRGPLLAVVECKQSLSLAVIEQASDWCRGYAHVAYIAVPSARKVKGRRMAEQILRHMGVGLIEASGEYTRVAIEPRIHRRADLVDKLRSKLRDEHKTWASAGTRGGGYYTEFGATCRDVVRLVGQSPGMNTKQLVDGLRHHYKTGATARSALLKWGRKGVIDGVEIRREGKNMTWHPKAKEASRG